MLGYARLVPGPGFEAGRAVRYYAQRLVPFAGARRLVARILAAGIARRVPHTPCTDEFATAVAASLDAKGYAIVPDLLTPEAVTELRDWLAVRPVVLRDGSLRMPGDIPAGASIADYPLATVLEAPHVLALANAPFLMNLAVAYLGCRPTISTIGIRWSFPGKRSVATQSFHRDPDDWRFFKAFVYLSDVGEDCGPHLYVRGSHRTTGSLRARTFSRDAVARRFGPGAIVAVTGAAGTSFVADTWGVHAGPVPAARPRLMLEIGYSVLPVYALCYTPLRLDPRPDVDAYANRLQLAGPEGAKTTPTAPKMAPPQRN